MKSEGGKSDKGGVRGRGEIEVKKADEEEGRNEGHTVFHLICKVLVHLHLVLLQLLIEGTVIIGGRSSLWPLWSSSSFIIFIL